MNKSLIIAIVLPLILISCIPDENVTITPILEQERRISFTFFTDNDYSFSQYDTYFVKLNVGIRLIDKGTGQELKILEETTGWIPFKEIPKQSNKMLYEKSMNVDIHKYSIIYWYSHQVRIGEAIQMKAISSFLNNWENERAVIIKF